MAQYLDNNEDGVVDNPTVYEEMLDNNAFMVMWEKESELNRINVPDEGIGQELGNEENRNAAFACVIDVALINYMAGWTIFYKKK